MKEAIPSRRMRAAVVARLAATEVGTSTQMGQRMVNGDTRLAGRMGRCPPPGGGAHGEQGRQVSAEGVPDTSGEAV